MKIVAPERISEIASSFRGSGARVVFTHGVFDLLLPQHIDALMEARNKGTHLIVGLHSDESAKNIFGKERPLTPLQERVEVVAALTVVNYVTWFAESSPDILISVLQPEVIIPTIEDPGHFSAVIQKIAHLPNSSSS